MSFPPPLKRNSGRLYIFDVPLDDKNGKFYTRSVEMSPEIWNDAKKVLPAKNEYVSGFNGHTVVECKYSYRTKCWKNVENQSIHIFQWKK